MGNQDCRWTRRRTRARLCLSSDKASPNAGGRRLGDVDSMLFIQWHEPSLLIPLRLYHQQCPKLDLLTSLHDLLVTSLGENNMEEFKQTGLRVRLPDTETVQSAMAPAGAPI